MCALMAATSVRNYYNYLKYMIIFYMIDVRKLAVAGGLPVCALLRGGLQVVCARRNCASRKCAKLN
jgi:hypothetical protein